MSLLAWRYASSDWSDGFVPADCLTTTPPGETVSDEQGFLCALTPRLYCVRAKGSSGGRVLLVSYETGDLLVDTGDSSFRPTRVKLGSMFVVGELEPGEVASIAAGGDPSAAIARLLA